MIPVQSQRVKRGDSGEKRETTTMTAFDSKCPLISKLIRFYFGYDYQIFLQHKVIADVCVCVFFKAVIL